MISHLHHCSFHEFLDEAIWTHWNEFCKFEKLHQIPKNEGSWDISCSNCFLVKFLIYSHNSLTKGRSTQKLFSPELSEYWRPTLFEFKNISDWLHQWPSTFFISKTSSVLYARVFLKFYKTFKSRMDPFFFFFQGKYANTFSVIVSDYTQNAVQNLREYRALCSSDFHVFPAPINLKSTPE